MSGTTGTQYTEVDSQQWGKHMSHRWLNPTITAAAILLLWGCANPFATRQDEYGRIADAQSLHSAGVLEVQREGNQSGWGWRFGLNVAVPLGNEAAKSAYHRALLTRLQRIKAAELSVSYQSHNYRGEQGEYKLGLRTSTEVLEAENLLANSKIDEIAAIVEYPVAQIDLAFATGMLLGASGVSW